jgi:REP element-mobilizing transposase RayT
MKMESAVMTSKQIALPGLEKEFGPSHFGGSLLKGNPRDARPIAVKRAMHLVLKSKKAVGARSFLAPARAAAILVLMNRVARLHGIRIHRYANGGNHLHLIVQTPSRVAFHKFLRGTTGVIARMTLGVERGRARGEQGLEAQALPRPRSSFWDARPFTRIIQWGRDFQKTNAYVIQNTLEALGFIAYVRRRGDERPG